MKRAARPLFRNCLISTLALLCLSLLPVAARAQSTRNYTRDFGVVTSWQLSFTVTTTGSGSRPLDDFGDKYSWSESETIAGGILLKNCGLAGCNCVPSSTGQGCDATTATVTTTINDMNDYTGEAPTTVVSDGQSYTPQGAGISYDFTSNSYYISVDNFQPGALVTYPDGSTSKGVYWNCLIPASLTSLPFPASGENLTYASGPGPSCASNPAGSQDPSVTTQIVFSLTPAFDLDLTVTIGEYDTWRPTAGRTEKDSSIDNGDPLVIQAALLVKGTGLPAPVGPQKLTYTLKKVSSEPGVAMNWPPPNQATSDPDLSFDTQVCEGSTCFPINQGFTINDPTIAQYTDPPSSIWLAQLVSHDWGATATLNVDASVDGLTFHGHLQLPPPAVSDPNATDILIPKRQTGSMIADTWKTAKGIPLDMADDDDSESTPKGNGSPGDGFTLYEEYRGFYMGCADNNTEPMPEDALGALCQHVEGDPKTKDLFVVTLISVSPAMTLFENTTKLKVHYFGLECGEIDATLDNSTGLAKCLPNNPGTYRVMNVNHTDGPHEVDQHALVMVAGILLRELAGVGINIDSINCPNPPVPHACRPGLPKEVDHIEIGAKAQSSTPAHELGHAVGIYHHGDVGGREFWTIGPNGQALAFSVGGNNALSGTGTPIQIFPEIGGLQIPLDPTLPTLRLNRSDPNNPTDATGAPRPGKIVQVGNVVCNPSTDLGGNVTGTVLMHGLHSGPQESYMRYNNAEAYIPISRPGIRIWTGIDEGERTDLSDDPTGTGVNQANRTPPGWARYGDAFRGKDLSQIDVNDAHDSHPENFPDQTCSSAGGA